MIPACVSACLQVDVKSLEPHVETYHILEQAGLIHDVNRRDQGFRSTHATDAPQPESNGSPALFCDAADLTVQFVYHLSEKTPQFPRQHPKWKIRHAFLGALRGALTLF